MAEPMELSSSIKGGSISEFDPPSSSPRTRSSTPVPYQSHKSSRSYSIRRAYPASSGLRTASPGRLSTCV